MLHKYLTAFVAVPLLIVFFIYAPLWAFSLLVAAFSLLALWEVYELLDARGLRASRGLGLALGGLLFVGSTWVACLPLDRRAPYVWLAVVVICSVAALAVLLSSPGRLEIALGRFCSTMAGVFYIPFLMAHFVLLRGFNLEDPSVGVNFVFYLLAVVWASDSGAFIIGSWIGRHPLAPSLSPKKSLEGAVGGLLFAVAVSFLAPWVLDLSMMSSVELLVAGLTLGLLGQAGDLVESALKRSAGVKDSGALLPGHGGMLDRADSLVLTGPLFYLYLSMSHGVG